MTYDVFISHASEDKAEVARPLSYELQRLGLKVWLDEFELTLGDSLRRSIERGLTASRFGVVVLSPAFFSKEWPRRELDGLFARETGSGKVILPVWHNLSHHDIVQRAPMLADKIAVSTAQGIPRVALEIQRAVFGMAALAASVGGPVDSWKALPEAELSQIRRRMLLTKHRYDLQKLLYETEELLSRYPHYAGARLVKDEIERSLRWSNVQQAEPGAGAPTAPPPSRSFVRPLVLIVLLVVLLVAGYVLYRLLT